MRLIIHKGSASSGHHGHAGRPGKIGGSAPSHTQYHGTYNTNNVLDEILKEGIKPGKRNWQGRPLSVYTTENIKIAMEYALNRARNRGQFERGDVIRGIVFEIEVPSDAMDKFVPDDQHPEYIAGEPLSGNSWRLEQTIPASWIKSYTHYELKVDDAFYATLSDELVDKLFLPKNTVTLKDAPSYNIFYIPLTG